MTIKPQLLTRAAILETTYDESLQGVRFRNLGDGWHILQTSERLRPDGTSLVTFLVHSYSWGRCYRFTDEFRSLTTAKTHLIHSLHNAAAFAFDVGDTDGDVDAYETALKNKVPK